jgi:hypothetical protein
MERFSTRACCTWSNGIPAASAAAARTSTGIMGLGGYQGDVHGALHGAKIGAARCTGTWHAFTAPHQPQVLTGLAVYDQQELGSWVHYPSNVKVSTQVLERRLCRGRSNRVPSRTSRLGIPMPVFSSMPNLKYWRKKSKPPPTSAE